MATQSIELNCPGCETLLELDAGFAGGVCRCSTCATLMTVPAETGAAAPERLLRPESPDAPTPRPETPGEAAPAAAEPAGVTTYTTESGRTVRVDEGKIPMAEMKRKAAKWITILAFLGVLGVLVGVALLAVFVLQGADRAADTREIVADVGYDPDVNPFASDDPLVLGMPLGGGDAVVVDASGSRENWIGLAGESLTGAVGKLGGGARIAVAYATESGPRWLTPEGQLTAADALNPAAMLEQADAVDAQGRAQIPATISAVAGLGVDRVLLVLGRALDEREAQTIRETLDAQGRPELDVVLVGIGLSEASGAARVAEDYDGQAVEVPVQRLLRWYRDRP